jgi:gluconolactonase
MTGVLIQRVALAFVLAVGCARARLPDAAIPAPLDPVAGAGTPELVAQGFEYLEGPAWAGGRLLFVDPRKSKLYQVDGDGDVDIVLDDSGGSGGLAVANGDVFLAQARAHQVGRLSGGVVVPLARAVAGQPLDRPNDLVVRSDGTIYFTEPFTRRVVRVFKDGVTRIEWQGPEGTKPNGIALSPDEKTLYVTDTLENLVRAFDVHTDGHLSGGRVFVSGLGMDRESEWVTDGMAVDEVGNIYVASYPRPDAHGPGEIAVFAANGMRWGRLVIPRGPSNCAFGGKDRKTLFVTAQSDLYRLRMVIAGVL